MTPLHWDLAKWQGIDESVRETSPDAELIFERFQPDRDVAVKVFLDRKNRKALVISWSKDTEVFSEKNGKADLEQASSFSSLEKGEWIHKPKDGLSSLTLVSILSEIHITWDGSETKPATALVLVPGKNRIWDHCLRTRATQSFPGSEGGVPSEEPMPPGIALVEPVWSFPPLRGSNQWIV
jgi:hypothetical protein